MTNKETVERNIGLTIDFVNYLADNPSIAENLPDNFRVEFMEKDFPNIEKSTSANTTQPQTLEIVRVRNTFEVAHSE
jgi:hypothetical protein